MTIISSRTFKTHFPYNFHIHSHTHYLFHRHLRSYQVQHYLTIHLYTSWEEIFVIQCLRTHSAQFHATHFLSKQHI